VAVQKKGPLTVLVVGPAGAGKSSTVNAIFGRQLLAAKPAEVSLPEFACPLSFCSM
jgi:predicted GTPase